MGVFNFKKEPENAQTSPCLISKIADILPRQQPIQGQKKFRAPRVILMYPYTHNLWLWKSSLPPSSDFLYSPTATTSLAKGDDPKLLPNKNSGSGSNTPTGQERGSGPGFSVLKGMLMQTT